MSIISPMWFYWISVLGTLKKVFEVAVPVLFIAFVGSSIISFVVNDSSETYTEPEKEFIRIAKNGFKIFLILEIIACVGYVFVPSEETMYKMLVANVVTYENVDKAEKAIKDSVDYIFDKVDNSKKDK